MTGWRLVLSCFTLTFDSSPIKGEGILEVGVVLLAPSLHRVDSRLRGNDGSFAKVSDGRGIKGEGETSLINHHQPQEQPWPPM